MKKIFSTLLIGMIAVGGSVSADAQQLAFPGAEGFGRFATGGRGGTVYHVTNLNDSGAGSFRDAVSKTGRIIVFDVSGTIHLKSALVVKGNNTILGQTAPGEGIQVYGNRVSFSGADNLICRYIRFRMGVGGDSGKDACGIANGENMIFDHLSVLWGRDENFSVSWDNKGKKPTNITIQNSIIGQGLQSHSCGGLIQTDGGVTIYRNLYIENKTRNVKAKGLNQYVNNVIYNWGDGGAYIQSDSEGATFADIEGNYFMNAKWNNAKQPFTRGIQSFHFYGADNYWDSNKDGEINGTLMTEEQSVGQQDGTAPYSTPFASLAALNADIDAYNTTNGTSIQNIPEIQGKMTAGEALLWVSQNVGPSLPCYDEVDQYIIDELTSWGTVGTRNGISSEKTLPHKGTGVLSGGVKPQDSDNDGMPDAWETANGLNPNDPSDAMAIAANGYCNLENYANSITEAFPYIKKPVSLAVTAQNKTSLVLAWDVNKNTEHGFSVELKAADGQWAEHSVAPAGTTSYEVTGLAPETEYTVRVRATDGQGLYSDYTEEVLSETTGDPSAPKASVNPTPADGGKEGIASGLTLKWENPSKNYYGEVKYSVYMGESADALAKVAENLTAKEYTVANAEANKTYYWRVDATNDLGTTPSEVWSFSTTAGGILFYTDFYKQPQGWADKFGSISDNTNVMNAANTTVSVGGMTFGAGDDAIRIVAMSAANMSTDSSKDYGPATAEDAGASERCVQFVTTKPGGYVTFPEVQGPCVVTMYLGNPDKSAKTVKLNTVVNGTETTVADLNIGAKKRIFKFTYTYNVAGPVVFKIDANSKKFNINDFQIERYVPQTGEQVLELTSGNLVNENMSYADGLLTLTFNQDIVYNGGATLSGKHQFENISVSANGKKVDIAYEALDVLSEYTVSFPQGAITTVDGKQSFAGDVKINTVDFGPAKADGETHYGKEIADLPANFRPFTAVSPFPTVSGFVQ